MAVHDGTKSAASTRADGLLPALMDALDHGRMLAWTAAQPADLTEAYGLALQARQLRVARGERSAGFKIGFTNRNIWPRYGVYAPIWGTVYAGRLVEATGDVATLSLAGLVQPRIEPEIVFGLRATPPAGADLAALARCIAWVAQGFEIVHTHFPFWKFTAAQTVADFGLHGALVVGPRLMLDGGAPHAKALADELPLLALELWQGDELRDSGQGAHVLDGPLQALLHFLAELRAAPGAPDLVAGDVVTTGTITDAWGVEPGQTWSTRMSGPGLAGRLRPLTVSFVA